MKMQLLRPVRVSADLRLSTPAGDVPLTTEQALGLADELAYRAYLQQAAVRTARLKQRRIARAKGIQA